MKVCKTCNKEKEYSEFRSSKRHKDGYLSECKECMAIKRKEYYLENIDRHKKNSKQYYEKNKKEIYQKIDKEKKRENDRRYSLKNKEKLNIKKKIYYQENKERLKEKSKDHYQKNKDKINKPSERKSEIRRRSYRKRKYQYIWREILRKTVYQLKHEKTQTTAELLGYSYDELKLNLESKFIEGMSWENHGEWHVDHIVPIALFREGTDPSIVNRLDNLRPIWSYDNLTKQAKIDTIEEEYSYLLEEFKEYLKF